MSDIIEAAARALRDESYMFFEMDEAQRLAGAVLAAVTPLIRAEALEEAAKVAENHPWGCPQIGTAIRALISPRPSPSADSA